MRYHRDRLVGWALLWLLSLSACWPTETPTGTRSSRGARPGTADWRRFGWNVSRSNAPKIKVGMTAPNLDSLGLQQVAIDGTVDASAIYLHAATLSDSSTHNVFFVTTTYGKTLAIDADSGTVLWRYIPPSYAGLAGSAQITTATPVADPNGTYLYVASPDGNISKLAVADGSMIWSTPITLQPSYEKIGTALNYYNGRVIATTGGYNGDIPPYVGHVAILDAGSGTLLAVWNALCSDQVGLMDPSTCPQWGAAIWGRAGAVIDSSTGNIYVATGNGLWDGATNWGDAILELDSLGNLVGNYTPNNTLTLDSTDTDLGSTSPVLVGGSVIQGGKDGLLRLVPWTQMTGNQPNVGGEQQVVPMPTGCEIITAPAVLQGPTATWVFTACDGAIVGWQVTSGGLSPVWQVEGAGTSPVVADSLLFVYNMWGAGLQVYQAYTGTLLSTLPAGPGHWNSPIVVDGRIALPEGNANDHDTTGVFDIWRVTANPTAQVARQRRVR